ncbi:DUF58 domain-containing protein [Acinetobacter sp. 187]|uniref:DUF58 domain-containing protein n=1 Tax=Acinetobacter lanii TaxID=2715163 RepID=UPI00140B1961|nr:DUF58 domain-containing protein [Acinetobacter lanii]NHC02375.1 DUF58 domain-containing protein [Acinetobacter lanii]
MLKAQLRQWMAKRFSLTSSKQLKQRDILIFIYQQGYLYLVLILITFIAGINYANNLILGFCFLINVLLCISFYLTFKQLHQLEIEFILPEVGRVNNSFILQVYLKQATPQQRYLYLKVNDEIQPILFQDTQLKIELSLKAMTRGAMQIPPIQLYSTYPLGLVRAWSYFYLSEPLWIAPEAKHFQNNVQATSSLGEPDFDEFRELRNYQAGDSLHAVSWKQAARGQGLSVKQFEDQKDANVITIDYAHMPTTNHEEKLSLMMGLVDECEQQQIRYRLILNQHFLEQSVGTQQYLKAQFVLAQAD